MFDRIALRVTDNYGSDLTYWLDADEYDSLWQAVMRFEEDGQYVVLGAKYV